MRHPPRLAVLPLVIAVILLLPPMLVGCASTGETVPPVPASSAAAVADGPVDAGSEASGAAPAGGSSAAVSAAVSAAARPAPGVRAGSEGLPPGVPEPPTGTTQVVIVVAPSATATTATLRAWQRDPSGGWRSVRGPIPVRVGTDGVGRADESTRHTPAGSFSLDQAFGRLPNPGTRLPYRQVGDQDWWVSDPHSPVYNTYQHCRPGTCPFDENAGENLGDSGPSYDHALVIGYNTVHPVPGAGSAFFLHVDAGVPSAGCVEVPKAEVVALLRWLDPAQRPRITIGVG